MNKTTLVIVTATTLFVPMMIRSAAGDVRLVKPDRRPYIVEIGEPYSVDNATVDREAKKINRLDEYLSDYGYPDYAEIQEIEPEWPWESYEIRLYYMRRNIETVFGHVMVSPALTNLGLIKYLGPIAPDKRHQIDVILQARLTPPAPVPPAPVEAAIAPPPVARQASSGGLSEAVVARLEAAAERASRAADMAVEASDAAAHAADRTVTILEKMEQSPPAPTSKRRSRSP